MSTYTIKRAHIEATWTHNVERACIEVLYMTYNVREAHIALSSLHESTTLRELTIKLLHDIQRWEASKLYWLIVDSHRWLRTLHVCNSHSWLSWEILLAHEKQRRATIVVLSCLKELLIATSTQRHELKHMQKTKFNYSARFQAFYLFNITKTYIVEKVCTKALQRWESYIVEKLHCRRSCIVEEVALLKKFARWEVSTTMT